MASEPRIHRYPREHEGAFVNAYLVETESSVVAIDSLLTVSESRAMRAGLEELGKPLGAVLLTHSHPDHYGGLTVLVAGEDVPIVAPEGVIDTIARDDEAKERILRPMFGDEWAMERTFPNTAIRDGENVSFDNATFTVIDLGPSESPHDSPWLLGDDERTVFLGDGGPVGAEMWAWQRNYIELFLDAVRSADWASPDEAKAAVVARMKEYEPTNELQFLMELSIEPVAAKLGLTAPAA